jgi:hypothetical protein
VPSNILEGTRIALSAATRATVLEESFLRLLLPNKVGEIRSSMWVVEAIFKSLTVVCVTGKSKSSSAGTAGHFIA